MFGLVGTSVELSEQGIVSAKIENGNIIVTSISTGSMMLKLKDNTKTAGIHLKVDELGNITTVNTYPYTGNNRPPILVKAHEPLSTIASKSVSSKVAPYFVDLENDELVFVIQNGVYYGSLLLYTKGEFTYTPNEKPYAQNDNFIIRAYDPSGGYGDIKVDIIITQ